MVSRAIGTKCCIVMVCMCAHVDFLTEEDHRLLSNSQQSLLPKMFRVTDLAVNQPSDPHSL